MGKIEVSGFSSSSSSTFFSQFGAASRVRIARFEVLFAFRTIRANATRVLKAREGEAEGGSKSEGGSKNGRLASSLAPWLLLVSRSAPCERETTASAAAALASLRSFARDGPWRRRTPFSLSKRRRGGEGRREKERSAENLRSGGKFLSLSLFALLLNLLPKKRGALFPLSLSLFSFLSFSRWR